MTDIKEVLEAIYAGYPGEIKDGYIIVRNPKYEPDNGANPSLVISAAMILLLLDPK